MRAGSITVTGVAVERQYDSAGDEHLQVTLTLSDPPGGQEIWSLEDAFTLRQDVRRAAAELDLAADIAITIASSGDTGTADENDDSEGDPDEVSGGQE